MNTALISRLIELRENHKLTQQDVADSIGCSLRTYTDIERGNTDPKLKWLIGLADLYAVSVDYLIGRSDIASNTGLCPEALQILTADFKDVKNRLHARNNDHIAVKNYSADPSDFQNLATVLNFLLTKGRADRGSGGLLDLIRAYLGTPDDAIIDGLPDGISAAGRRGFHLDSGQVAAGMYYARIQQILVQYRAECQNRKKRKSPK